MIIREISSAEDVAENLKYMKRFANEYSSDVISQQAVDQLSCGNNDS